jgi:hypothetical protein
METIELKIAFRQWPCLDARPHLPFGLVNRAAGGNAYGFVPGE